LTATSPGLDTPRYRAYVDFDEPEPAEEFDDDDFEDDEDDRNALTDILDWK